MHVVNHLDCLVLLMQLLLFLVGGGHHLVHHLEQVQVAVLYVLLQLVRFVVFWYLKIHVRFCFDLGKVPLLFLCAHDGHDRCQFSF